jgi:nucleoside-diphosphate-sugar epimerase
MARILITGAAGFIGSHMAAACVMAGHEVHVVLRPQSDEHRLRALAGRIGPHRLDLRQAQAVRSCVAAVQPEFIYHLASRPRRAEQADFGDAHAYLEEDLASLINLLAAAAETRRPPRRLVRGGSLAEYGAAPSPYREDRREAPLGVYGAGLVAGTHLCAALQPRLPFPVVTARLALTYGPAQSTDYLLPLLIRRCLEDEETFVRHPLDRRDLIHVDDVIDALLRLGTAPLPAGNLVVNVASGVAPSMRSVAELVLAATGAEPALIRFGSNQASSGAADLRGSTARAKQLLGWRPRIPLAVGIQRTVDWYRDQRIRLVSRSCESEPIVPHASEVSP